MFFATLKPYFAQSDKHTHPTRKYILPYKLLFANCDQIPLNATKNTHPIRNIFFKKVSDMPKILSTKLESLFNK